MFCHEVLQKHDSWKRTNVLFCCSPHMRVHLEYLLKMYYYSVCHDQMHNIFAVPDVLVQWHDWTIIGQIAVDAHILYWICSRNIQYSLYSRFLLYGACLPFFRGSSPNIQLFPFVVIPNSYCQLKKLLHFKDGVFL